MTVLMTCDHCAPSDGSAERGTIVDRRSRDTMVRQLRSANSLADTLSDILVGHQMTVDRRVGRRGVQVYDLVLRLGPSEVAELIAELVNYQTLRPLDGDLAFAAATATGDDDGTGQG